MPPTNRHLQPSRFVSSRVSPGIFGAALACALLVGSPSWADSPFEGRVPVEPHKIMGYEACSKCHAEEIKVWQLTPHCRTFQELHRREEAEAIAQRMGIRSIKRGEICIQCHYTQQEQNGRIKPISGVSCESCHGASRDWIEIHNDYGGPEVTKEQETQEHRVARLRQSIANGMRNPVNLYLVARSCYNCHTVPHEELVNVGGHKAGSETFEIVSWSQGMVRHNFLRTDGQTNAKSSQDRLRVMFIVGVMTDLEYSLRATALATEKARYGVTCAKRADAMRKKLEQVQQLVQNDFVQQALDAANSVQLKLNNRAELEAAANAVGTAALHFADKVAGSTLDAVDPLIPSSAEYK